jgi:hypothetical protein
MKLPTITGAGEAPGTGCCWLLQEPSTWVTTSFPVQQTSQSQEGKPLLLQCFSSIISDYCTHVSWKGNRFKGLELIFMVGNEGALELRGSKLITDYLSQFELI